MSIPRPILAGVLVTAPMLAMAEGPGLGQPLSQDEIPQFSTYIMPDGTGLPEGGGSAAEGAELYALRCAQCHGPTGTEGPIMPPVGPNEVWAKPAGRH